MIPTSPEHVAVEVKTISGDVVLGPEVVPRTLTVAELKGRVKAGKCRVKQRWLEWPGCTLSNDLRDFLKSCMAYMI